MNDNYTPHCRKTNSRGSCSYGSPLDKRRNLIRDSNGKESCCNNSGITFHQQATAHSDLLDEKHRIIDKKNNMKAFNNKILGRKDQVKSAFATTRRRLLRLQENINSQHDAKEDHINQLKINIQELNAINNTRKIQRSNFTEMNMGKYYFINIISLLMLIGIFVFWAMITKNMKSEQATFQSVNTGIIGTVIIIIIFGFLTVNAFWGQNARDYMKKDNYLYQFPQF